MTFDAILFDNDGVLVDTEALYFQANREALAGVGVELDEATYVELFLREGLGAWHLAEARGVSAAGIEALRAARDRRYFELVDPAPLVIPGVAELLPKLAARFRMAIVTSSEPVPFARTHARTGLLPHFELVLTRVDYQQSKPDPEPYLTAVARLGVPAARCLVIEDSERGLRAAKAAGLACWVVPSGLTVSGNFAAADAVLRDLTVAAARLLGTS
jgi:HAD superfamily hydrolase (TIGR01509 family)